MILASVVLCVIVAIFCIIVINTADDSMMQDKIDENKISMQQAAAKVQKDFNAKSDYISAAADSLSGSENNFEKLIGKKSKELKKLAKSGDFELILIADPDGNAYDYEGNVYAVSKLAFFAKASAGHSGISGKINPGIPGVSNDAIAYYAPITGEEDNIAFLVGFVPAVLHVADYTDYALNPYSGMYILDSSGKVMQSEEGEDAPKELTVSTDYYAGHITNSRSFFSLLSDNENVSSIYFKKKLSTNGWTLFYVRSVTLSESTVSFIILSRVLLFGIVAIFFVAMVAMLLIQWLNGRKITEMAYKDEITGYANWQKFVALCNSRLSNKSWWKSKHAALCIDINRFTIYNDYYGHKAGNRLLKYIAETLELMCSSREMSARRSGDIFVVLWSYSSADDLTKRINDLFELVKDGPTGENVSLSVGVYLLADGDKDIVHAVDMASITEQTIDDAKTNTVAYFDNYILEQLCIFQRNRLRRGYKTVPISVNVSRVQLSDPNLAHEICSIVDKYNVPHKYIDIELTESACFDDMDVLITTITKLRSMGFPVSMDDFGSGYSSLNLLKELPFDTLKIDGEFFRNVTDAHRANVVVKNIIDLAKSLDMTVVAEGIESQEQVDFLRTTDCDLIQGYFYSKPISAKEFEDYMSKQKIENK